MLPYFKRSERNYRGENKYHGGDGPLNVRLAKNPALLYEPLRDAAKAAGIPETDDMHGDNPSLHPELLNALAEEFKASGFDVKYLLRSITSSRSVASWLRA